MELWRDKVNGHMRRLPGRMVYSNCTRFSRHRFTHRGRSTVKRKTWMINEGCRRHQRCKHTYNVYIHITYVIVSVCVIFMYVKIYICEKGNLGNCRSLNSWWPIALCRYGINIHNMLYVFAEKPCEVVTYRRWKKTIFEL